MPYAGMNPKAGSAFPDQHGHPDPSLRPVLALHHRHLLIAGKPDYGIHHALSPVFIHAQVVKQVVDGTD